MQLPKSQNSISSDLLFRWNSAKLLDKRPKFYFKRPSPLIQTSKTGNRTTQKKFLPLTCSRNGGHEARSTGDSVTSIKSAVPDLALKTIELKLFLPLIAVIQTQSIARSRARCLRPGIRSKRSKRNKQLTDQETSTVSSKSTTAAPINPCSWQQQHAFQRQEADDLGEEPASGKGRTTPK